MYYSSHAYIRACMLWCHRRIHVCSRACAENAALHGMCTSATLYVEDRITDLCVHHRRAHVSADVRVRAGACAYGRPRICAANVRACSVGVDRMWLGSQAFNMASAFNANIGAWNSAAVTSMAYVCAAFGRAGPAARHRKRPGRARPVSHAARAVVRGGTADAHARVCAQE